MHGWGCQGVPLRCQVKNERAGGHCQKEKEAQLFHICGLPIVFCLYSGSYGGKLIQSVGKSAQKEGEVEGVGAGDYCLMAV